MSSRERKPERTWLIWPGAGSNRDHHTLVACDDRLDLTVRRCQFEYQDAGRRAPDGIPKLRSAVERAIDDEVGRGTAPGAVIVGGRSMGGRICSMVAAETRAVAGVILLSYPLHPLGRPERLRVSHFENLTVPTLFVCGDRDPMCPRPLLEKHVGAIAGPVDVHWLVGQRHDPKGCDDEIVDVCANWLRSL